MAGSRAQVVVANPAGITCDGCGFINTERATLTTGTPIMNGGSLDGYRVERGQILIQGNGLDASQTDYTDLIARSVQVNAGIWTKELRVTAGANELNAANTQATPITGSGPAPAFAIDVAQLGGMYAGKIHLIGTEAGVGVRNAGTLGASAGEVRITVDGQLINSGSITSSETTTITVTTLTNRGLIDGASTQLAANTLDNLGTGRIYGDHIGIAADTLNNDVESGTAATIAARNRLDLGVGTLNNREHALIHSEGDLAIGGALNASFQATGAASVVNNASATLEAQGNLTLSALSFNNTNEHFTTEQVLVSTESIHEHLGEGASVRYDHSLAYTQNVRDSFYRWIINGGEYDRSYEFIYTRTVTETQVKSSDPAKLTAGGNLQLNIGSALNDKSQIIAGGNLDIVGGTLTNTTVPGQHITTDSGTVKHYIDHQPSGKNNDWTEVQTSAYTPAPATLSTDLTPTVASPNTTPSSTLPAGSLPNNSLYSQNPAVNAIHLIETDPRFANYRSWLSSDYMQQFLALDPSVSQKRLGDGFYEQQLIREQIAELTGRRFLTGYASDEAQYQALMESAVTQARAFNLRLGVALSPAQIAQLTSDIVWLVEKEVTLADGSVQKVLAPQVYLMPRTGDLLPSGALLSGANIRIDLSGDLVNRGSIAGRQIVNLTANNLKNPGGAIRGDTVNLTAQTDLDNQGGRIEAISSLTLQAGQDLTVASTTSKQNTAQGSRNNIDRIAGLYVTGLGGSLTAVAGRDMNLNATEIVNAGSGTTTLAAGNNLSLGAVTESERQTLVFDSRNHRNETTSADVGTRLRTQGDLTLLAGNDLTGKAVDAKAQGNLTLTAGNDVILSAGQRTQNIDEASFSQSKSKGFGGLGGTKRSASATFQLDRSDVIDNTLAGQNVTIQSGRDLALEGGTYAAQDKLALAAGRDLTVAAGESYATEQTQRQLSQQDNIGFGRQSLKTTRDETSVTPDVAHLAGREISLTSGNDLALVAPGVRAETLTATAGGALTVEAATATHELKETSEFKSNRLNFSEITAPLRGSNGVQNSLGLITPNSAVTGGRIKDKIQFSESGSERVAVVAEISAKEITLNSANDTTLLAPHLQTERLAVTAGSVDGQIADANAKIQFLGVKESSSTSGSKNSHSFLHETVRDSGQSAETLLLPKIESPNTVPQGDFVPGAVNSKIPTKPELALAAPGGIVVGATSLAPTQREQKQAASGSSSAPAGGTLVDLKNQAQTLAQQPGLAWLGELAQRQDVDWQKIELATQSWDYKHAGLTQEGAIVVAIVVTALTWGAGSGLAATGESATLSGTAEAGLTATTTTSTLGGTALSTTTTTVAVDGAVTTATTYTAAGAALNAGFSTLASQAAVSLVNNQGDVGKTLKDLGSKDSIKQIVASMLTAGATQGISSALNLPSPANAGFADRFANYTTKAAVSAGVQSAVYGTPLSETAKTALVSSLAQTLTSEIGDWGKGNEAIVAKTIAHAVVQCAAASIQSKDCGSAAIGAATAEALSPLLDQLDSRTKEAGFQQSLGASIAGMSAMLVASLTGKNPITALNSAQMVDNYNRQLHPEEAKRIEKIAGQYAEKYGISLTQAIAELTQQVEQNIDTAWDKRLGSDNPAAQAFLKDNGLGQRLVDPTTGQSYQLFTADAAQRDNHAMFAQYSKTDPAVRKELDLAMSKAYLPSDAQAIKTPMTGSDMALNDAARDFANMKAQPASVQWSVLAELRGTRVAVMQQYATLNEELKNLPLTQDNAQRRTNLTMQLDNLEQRDTALLGAAKQQILDMGAAGTVNQFSQRETFEGVGEALAMARLSGKGISSASINARIDLLKGAIAEAKAASTAEKAVAQTKIDLNFYKDWSSPTDMVQNRIVQLAERATQNPNADTVVLGKYTEGSASSYEQVAKAKGATYFELPGTSWAEAEFQLGPNKMWSINELFLEKQVALGKSFEFTNNPTAPEAGYFTKLEFRYLSSQGYSIKKDGEVYRAVKK